jgi:Chemotaxis protein histidine kinase and related kinases
MSDAHKTFVRESEEGITDLNNALLDLEADPDDPEAMDLIFRTAHTLKGNAAAMGFEQFSGLAHAMEDLLDEVRDGEIGVTTELMDMLFEAVDILDAMLGEIEETGDATADTAGLEERLRAVADGDVALDGADAPATGEDTAGEPDTEDGDTAGETADPETYAHGLEPGDDEGVYLASVDVGDTGMPGVDAMFVLEAAEESFPAVETFQGREAIEDGEFEETFELYLRDEDAETVSAGLSAVSQVAAVDVTALEPSPDDDPSTGTAPADEDATGDTTTDDTESDETEESETAGGTTTSSSESISSIRVDVEQLDELYGLVEQLVTSRIKLRREMEEAGIDSENLDELDKISSNLQNTVMDMRLIPLSSVVDTFPRLVRDLARDQDKQVDFEIDGRDIELDRTILTEIRDPLVHILRNAVDHGIESPAEREAAGEGPDRPDRTPCEPGTRPRQHRRRGRRRRDRGGRSPRDGRRGGREDGRRGGGDGRRRGQRADLPPRAVDQRGGDGRERPRGRDGRGPDDGETARRHRLVGVDTGRGESVRAPAPGDGRHRPGDVRHGRRDGVRHPDQEHRGGVAGRQRREGEQRGGGPSRRRHLPRDPPARGAPRQHEE